MTASRVHGAQRRAAGRGGTARGSQATFDGYPRVCSGCGDRVVITGLEPLWFETINGVSCSWHVRCYPRSAR